MNDTSKELDQNPTNDLQSVEIAVGDNHAIHSTSTAKASLSEETDNDEEQRLLHILSLACHQLQPKHDLLHHSDETSCSTDQPSMELLWSTIDNALKSLCTIWLNATSASPTSSTFILRKSTRCGNVTVADHEIEVVLSCILTIWHHSLDSLSDEVTNSTIISAILSSIQLLSQSTQSIHWKHELVNHQMEKLVVLLPKTASIFLSKSSNDTSSDKCTSIDCTNEEKKTDDVTINEFNTVDNSKPSPKIGIVRAVFRMVKDISYNESNNSISTNSDNMIALYNAMHSIICDCNVYSKTMFMIDISSILWRWSVTLAQWMVDNTCVWNAIQFMWIHSNQNYMSMNGHNIVIRALASAVGMLIASVPCEEVTTEISSSTSSSSSSLRSISSEYDKPIKMVQEQDWLMPMLLKGIRTADSDGQRRCIRTLRYLTASRWGKSFVFQYAQHKGLTMDVLTIIRNDGRHDEDTCALACQVLENVLSDGHSELQLGPYIETSLLETIIGSSSYGNDVDSNGRGIKSRNKLVLSACQALIASLQYSPWNRSTGCFSEALFEEMLYVLHNNVDQPLYHICFVNLFLQLVAEEGPIDDVDGDSRMKPTRIKGICVALASYSSFLEMLAILLSPNATKPDFDVPRSNTVRVLTILLQHDDKSNCLKNNMARDEHLLTALLNVCLMNNGSSLLKDEAKRIIMILIPEL